MRALNLAKAAENRLTTPTSAPSTTKKKAAKKIADKLKRGRQRVAQQKSSDNDGASVFS